MTKTRWGGDDALLGGWILHDSFAWRVLLPAWTASSPISWAQVGQLHDNQSPVDGYITWAEVTAWKGSGPPGPSDCDQPSYPDDGTSRILQDCLSRIVGDQPWRSETGTDASLAQVVQSWQRDRHLGRWSCADVGLTAPPFADSVIISGPTLLGEMLLGSGQEAWPVAPSHSLPQMTS